MDPVTAQLIMMGVMFAEELIFRIGERYWKVDVSKVNDPAELAQAIKDIEASKSHSWPKYSFMSPVDAYKEPGT